MIPKKTAPKKKKSDNKVLDIGAVIKNPGNTDENKTGGWRALRPVWDEKK